MGYHRINSGIYDDFMVFKWDFSSDSFMDLSSDTTGMVPQSAFDAVGVWVMYRTSFNGCAIYL